MHARRVALVSAVVSALCLASVLAAATDKSARSGEPTELTGTPARPVELDEDVGSFLARLLSHGAGQHAASQLVRFRA